jgi:hypothetical protein
MLNNLLDMLASVILEIIIFAFCLSAAFGAALVIEALAPRIFP